jgi:uncharacterized protein (DUF697 family)
MTTCKQEAMRSVHRYAIGGAALAALPLPFTSAGLLAIESRLIGAVGEVYGERQGGIPNAVARGAAAFVGRAAKRVSKRAMESAPGVLRPVIRMAIAGATIEAIGLGLVFYYERKSPGRAFQGAAAGAGAVRRGSNGKGTMPRDVPGASAF